MGKGHEKRRRYYWDSCVFLSYLENDPDRVSHVESILNEAAAGKIQIVTSTLSIAEVAYTSYEKEGRVLRPREEERIDALWHPPVVLVEYHRRIAMEARRLIRESFATDKPTLKPSDAIHAATAHLHQADAFHTYDTKLTRAISALLPFDVGAPQAEQLSMTLAEGTKGRTAANRE